ncbi:MAG: CopG family transcriptional regulator [Deltaproteobacteria bacterium]|nr:CopG family transcriptional regulator [Deltaproteobacteria bacterium]
MKASKLDEKFDRGESVIDFLALDKARRPNLEIKRVNIDFPNWMVEALDKEARRIGVTRQAVIKMWIAERLKETR